MFCRKTLALVLFIFVVSGATMLLGRARAGPSHRRRMQKPAQA